MLDVGEGRIYAPTYDEVRMAPWRKRLPSRKEIIKELIKSTKRHQLLPLGIIKGKAEPDRKWMMNVLRTNEPNHRFFSKGYFPEKVKDDDSD